MVLNLIALALLGDTDFYPGKKKTAQTNARGPMAPLHYSLSSPGVKIAACFISASTPSLLSILETESQTLQSD